MQYSLDTRRRRLHLSRKDICDECNYRGRKINYKTVCLLFNEPEEVEYPKAKIVYDTISELEREHGLHSDENDF